MGNKHISTSWPPFIIEKTELLLLILFQIQTLLALTRNGGLSHVLNRPNTKSDGLFLSINK